jgi:YidC/Oxa1 family membrane protein insertase
MNKMKRNQGDMGNMMMALALSLLVLMWWEYKIEGPREAAELQAAKKAQAEQLLAPAQKAATEVPKTREELINQSPRIRIRSDDLHGSIALRGLRFDDLTLARYHETLDPKSPEVVLFSPAGNKDTYFATFGWAPPQSGAAPTALPDEQTLWTASSDTLSPGHPVTFTWKNPQGYVFTFVIALDDKYMFTLTQSATDPAGKPFAWYDYAAVTRDYDIKTHPAINILHEGPIGVFDKTLKESPYKSLIEKKEEDFTSDGGWLGISDKYWLSAIIPQGQQNNFKFEYYKNKQDNDRFNVGYASPLQTSNTLHFFAGAKELSVLDGYATQYQIPLFDRAVDFGYFYFLTKPIFITLNYFNALLGNFGLAILLLTVIVKAIMFPLANKSFKAMNQLKELQPKIKQIQERCKDDKTKLNQAMIELYKKEKVNPASGCLPMFIQIPVFFSLYKVLYVSIEMRHAPFFGWIHDLSAPDPTNLFTLFGYIPWHPPTLLHLGVWPMIMCATMVIQQLQSPPPPDPVQAKVMRLMPFFFLFIFSNFAAGLVIYWSWSNTLSILQQRLIKKRHGVAPVKKRA